MYIHARNKKSLIHVEVKDKLLDSEGTLGDLCF